MSDPIHEEDMLMKVLNDGEKLVMMYGSKWEINLGDIPTVCTWIPTSSIKITLADRNSFYPYELLNLAIDVSVRARRLTN